MGIFSGFRRCICRKRGYITFGKNGKNMNFFDDLKILSCGISRDPGSVQVRRAGNPENGEVRCPYSGKPCFSGWLGRSSIGILRGNTFRREAGRCRELARPFVYWMYDRELFSWCNPRRVPRENRWIIFSGERAPRVLAALDELAGGEHHYFVDDPRPLEILFDEIRDLHRTLTPATAYRVMPLFETLLVRLYDQARAEYSGSRVFQVVKDAEKLIRSAPAVHLDLAAFAERNHVSYDHFRDSFRRYLGVPPHDFLLNCRLETARRLLRERTLSIKEIAERCGFERASDFSRFFRNRTGMSPSDYQRSPGV